MRSIVNSRSPNYLTSSISETLAAVTISHADRS
jgi:hypothetical protein